MRDDTRNYVLVGVFVIAMLVSVIVWIALVGGPRGPTVDYYVVYRNVFQLKAGVEILYEGFPVGLIKDIEPIDREGRRVYRIRVSVERDWPIPEDSRAAVATGLFSAPVIDIRAGESEKLLPAGSEIQAEEATDVFAAVNEMASKVNYLLREEIEPLIQELARGTPEIVRNLEESSEKLKGAMDQVRAILEPGNVDRISSILNNLEAVSGDTSALVRDLGKTRQQLDSVIGRVDGILAEEGTVGQAASDLERTLGALARHMDAISANLEATTRNLNEFSRQLRDNPGVLIRGREQGDDT